MGRGPSEAGAVGITLSTPTDATALGIYRELIAAPIATNDTGASTSALVGLLATSGLDGIQRYDLKLWITHLRRDAAYLPR
ncbi:MAG: hypothetical protein ACYCXY_10320 [Acidimicrobiales bacterium]